jgi:hypothetical protein
MNKVSGIGIAVSVGLNLFTVEAMTSIKDILEATINRAVKNKKNRPEFAESAEQSETKMIGAVGKVLIRSYR